MYVLLVLSCVAMAAAPTTMPMHGHSLMQVYMTQGSKAAFVLLDLDKDGDLSQKEFETYFDDLDENGDGRMNLNEYINSTGMPHDMAQKEFHQLDVDKDGILTRAEINTIYNKFDTNNDGHVSENEFEHTYGHIMHLVHGTPVG